MFFKKSRFLFKIIGGAEYQDFFLDPLNGSVSLNRSLEDNELVQPVILVVKVNCLIPYLQLPNSNIQFKMHY